MKSNAQLATEMVAAYQRGDEEFMLALVDPQIEIHGEAGLINSGTYSGLEGFRHWTSGWEEAWEGTRYEIAQLTEIGEEFVVGKVRVTGTGKGSGVPMKEVFGWLWEFRNGKAIRFHTYVEHETALRRAQQLAGLLPEEDEE
jgi:ketosteroid isomerase-like protein